MHLLRDEVRKYRAFREPWIAWGLGIVYLLISVQVFKETAADIPARQNWFSVQQDIRSYGANVAAFLLCICLPRLVCCEQEQRTDCLIRSTERGCLETWLGKVLFTALYCALTVFVIGAVTLLVHGSAFGFEGALGPIDPSWCFYFDGGVPLSNLAYCLLQYGFLYLSALYFAGFILLTALCTRRTAVAIALCGAAYLVLFICANVHLALSPLVREAVSLLYFISFAGFLLQDSFTWSRELRNPVGYWGNIWKPIVLVLVLIALEYAALWLLWKRKARR